MAYDNTRANSSWAGPTFNAIDRDRAPGASSSGTATAVAAGFAPAGLAEETGGSIQSPSSAQSLVGVKTNVCTGPDQRRRATDYRGTESVAFDYTSYVKGLGVDSLDAFRELIGISPFDDGGPLHYYADLLPVLKDSLNHPADPPDLSGFNQLRAQYLTVFNRVFKAHHLDAVVFPQAIEALPPLFSDVFIAETTVSAINIGGLPGVTVPAGQYASNRAPFSLIFVGRPWSEADLLGLAYDHEQATHHRVRAHLSME